jgi:hypothetical protein
VLLIASATEIALSANTRKPLRNRSGSLDNTGRTGVRQTADVRQACTNVDLKLGNSQQLAPRDGGCW